MSTDLSGGDAEPRSPQDLRLAVAAYVAGDRRAADQACAVLEPVVRRAVRRFYPDTDVDHDDLVQDTLVGFLAYLQRGGAVPDSIEAFVVTMAGNRCRNLFRKRQLRVGVEISEVTERLSASGPDALEELEATERNRLLRVALERLENPCRRLLQDIYFERRPMEEIQKEIGLSTVQGAYYRKYACLKKLSEVLKKLCFGGQYPTPGRAPGGKASDE